jgi:glycosyltransferase involved in cell wall biosynthesis
VTASPLPEITVLVPTRGAPARRASLRRAVESVLCQRHVAPRVLIIVNGAEREPEEVAELRADGRVRAIVRAHADLPAAYREGARAVDTTFFATLDDDDLLLPDALKVRQLALERHPDRLVAVTNGILRKEGTDTIHVRDGAAVRADPLRAMLRRNWLLPGSWLCRTTPETRGLFDAMPRFLECTYLGLRFAMLGMVYVDEPTVIYHVGTPLSESHTAAYVDGQAEALRQILTLDLPPFVRRALRPRVAAAHHRSANRALRSGAVRDAWRWHVATLREVGGWRYLPFARRLIAATIRRRR